MNYRFSFTKEAVIALVALTTLLLVPSEVLATP
jgi:hypothetical protein